MTTTAIISDPGGYNAVRIKTNGADRSGAVDASGTLSAEVMTRDLVQFGLMRPKSKWIWIEANDVRLWGGVITDSYATNTGTTEIAATDFGTTLFDARLLPIDDTLFGPAGALALQAITRCERSEHLFIQDRTAEEYGESVQLSLSGQQLLDGLRSLQSDSGQEWAVDPDTLAFSWGRVGQDKRGTIQLVHPRHIVEYRLPDSLMPVVNQLRASIPNGDTKAQRMIVAESVDSVTAWGVRQGAYDFDEASSIAAFKPAAQAIVNDLAGQGVSLECRVVNKDRCWGWYREGDDICVLLPDISSQLDVRIMAWSLSDDDQVMSLSAVVTDWTVV